MKKVLNINGNFPHARPCFMYRKSLTRLLNSAVRDFRCDLSELKNISRESWHVKKKFNHLYDHDKNFLIINQPVNDKGALLSKHKSQLPFKIFKLYKNLSERLFFEVLTSHKLRKILKKYDCISFENKLSPEILLSGFYCSLTLAKNEKHTHKFNRSELWR